MKRGIIAKIIATGLATTVLGSCAIRPLPGDYGFKKEPTFDIIRDIRCEAKNTVGNRLNIALQNSNSEKVKTLTAEQGNCSPPCQTV